MGQQIEPAEPPGKDLISDEASHMGLDVNGNDGSLQIIDMLKGMSDAAAKNNIH
jgi:hypothetical protein